MRSRTRRRCASAPAVLCALGLLVQAALLPLAHTHHVAAFGPRDVTAAAGETTVRRPSAVPAHDGTTCNLCATLAHGRTGTMSGAVTAPLAQRTFGALAPACAVRWVVTALRAAAPRAPPVLSS